MARTKTAAQRTSTIRSVVKTPTRSPSPALTLNQLIRLRREASGLSLSELARKLGITTESLRDLEDHEDEIEDVPLWLARKLSSLLDIPAQRLMTNTAEQT